MYEVVFPGGNEKVKIRTNKILDSLLIESDAEHDAVPDELVMVIRYVPESPGFAQWSSIVRTPTVGMPVLSLQWKYVNILETGQTFSDLFSLTRK